MVQAINEKVLALSMYGAGTFCFVCQILVFESRSSNELTDY